VRVDSSVSVSLVRNVRNKVEVVSNFVSARDTRAMVTIPSSTYLSTLTLLVLEYSSLDWLSYLVYRIHLSTPIHSFAALYSVFPHSVPTSSFNRSTRYQSRFHHQLGKLINSFFLSSRVQASTSKLKDVTPPTRLPVNSPSSISKDEAEKQSRGWGDWKESQNGEATSSRHRMYCTLDCIRADCHPRPSRAEGT
jgi:hypothetical protein